MLVLGPAEPLPPGAAPALVQLYAYWRSLGPLPPPRAVDPTAIPRLLTQLLLIDVVGDDFRFRLVGESIGARYEGRLKGQLLGDMLQGTARRAVLDEHRAVVTQRRPVFTCNTEWSASLEDMLRYQRLLLPLSSDGRDVDRLLGGMAFEA